MNHSNVFIDITGQRFGEWCVLSRAESDSSGQTRYLCACSCGKTAIVRSCDLRRGHTKSCGCRRGLIHGMHRTRIYSIWRSMLQRCSNQRSPEFHNYGGRGISVCVEWLDFANFYRDMGERPEGLSLDRINNDGNYEPGNCKWSTPQEQSNNRRPHRKRVS